VTVGDLDEVSSAVEIVASAASMDAVIRPPGSKSITNRALLVAALARGESTLTDALYSDDTLVMAEALSSLGMRVETDAEERTFTVTGCDGKPAPGPAVVSVGHAGTVARFLPPLFALGSGSYDLDGSPRMRERPIAPLVRALHTLGVTVTHLDGRDGLPVRVRSPRLRRAVRPHRDRPARRRHGRPMVLEPVRLPLRSLAASRSASVPLNECARFALIARR